MERVSEECSGKRWKIFVEFQFFRENAAQFFGILQFFMIKEGFKHDFH
jgi:hypothetical protein